MTIGLDNFIREGKDRIKSILPQPVVNWREARYYLKYGEIELHLLDLLGDRERDAIDVGAHGGCYVLFLRRLFRRVYAFEPLPSLAAELRRKFRHAVTVREIALSHRAGTAELRTPLIDGVSVIGCSTISSDAASIYPGYRTIVVPMETIDNIYAGTLGFLKIDVEGHEDAVLHGARNTIASSRPTVLVEVVERFAPGGIRRVGDFFRAFGYEGYFIYSHNLLRIEEFHAATMQQDYDLSVLTASLAERDWFENYVCNFLFLPPGDGGATVNRIRERLANLERRAA
jgi:FkbM family methyltransferase